jgi:hypothetical protein
MIEYHPPFFFYQTVIAVFTRIKNQLEIFTKTLLNCYNALKYALKIYIWYIETQEITSFHNKK